MANNKHRMVEITAAQAEALRGVEYMPNCTFHPIEDADGKWVISEEEVKQCDGRTFGQLKALEAQARKHKPKALTDLPEQDKKEKL